MHIADIIRNIFRKKKEEVWCPTCTYWIFIDDLIEHRGRHYKGSHFKCPECNGSVIRRRDLE